MIAHLLLLNSSKEEFVLLEIVIYQTALRNFKTLSRDKRRLKILLWPNSHGSYEAYIPSQVINVICTECEGGKKPAKPICYLWYC